MTPAEMNTFAIGLLDKHRATLTELGTQLYAEMNGKEPEYSADGKIVRPDFQLLRAKVFELVAGELEFNIAFGSLKHESRRTADQGIG